MGTRRCERMKSRQCSSEWEIDCLSISQLISTSASSIKNANRRSAIHRASCDRYFFALYQRQLLIEHLIRTRAFENTKILEIQWKAPLRAIAK